MDYRQLKNESAFVGRRMIHDNIMVAQKIFHHLRLRKKWKKSLVAFKLDMNKACDWVKWGFFGLSWKK